MNIGQLDITLGVILLVSSYWFIMLRVTTAAKVSMRLTACVIVPSSWQPPGKHSVVTDA